MEIYLLSLLDYNLFSIKYTEIVLEVKHKIKCSAYDSSSRILATASKYICKITNCCLLSE